MIHHLRTFDVRAVCKMVCLSSRAPALARLDGFSPIAEHYARDRNHVIPGHPSVSGLSPAIRHRLITEGEVVSTVLRAHSFSRVEKFVQEVYWRRYWKSWLALRPEVWSEFLRDAATRAELIWKTPNLVETRLPYADVLLSWAKSLKLQQVTALRPEVGPLHDSLPSLRAALAKEGIRLALINRPEDLRVRPFATGGFFQFWEQLRKTLAETGGTS